MFRQYYRKIAADTLESTKQAVVLLLLIRCWMLLPSWDSGFVLCFVVRYFVSILALQSSRWGRESWLLCFVCLPGVLWLLCGSSSRYHGLACSLWLWYFLIIPTYYFCLPYFNISISEFMASLRHDRRYNIPFWRLIDFLVVFHHISQTNQINKLW